MPRRRKPKAPLTVKCAHCGGLVETRQPHLRFCSDWCRKAAYDKTHGRVSKSEDAKIRLPIRLAISAVVAVRRGTETRRVPL